MLTEPFINLSCAILLSEQPQFTDAIISEIAGIMASYDEESIPLQFRQKFTLCKSMLRLRMDNKDKEQILDSLLSSKHFNELESFIKILSQKEIPDGKIIAAVNQVCEKKQLVQLHRDIPEIEDFITKFNTNTFTDSNEILDHWNLLISKMHSNVLEEKRKEAKANIRELDLLNDDYTNVLRQIEISYSGSNCVSTGYEELDGYLNGGFEPTRLYIFGGSSGDGKSVLLNNFLRNAVEHNHDTTGPRSLFMYFTMENLIDESLVRLYCSIEDKDVNEIIQKYQYEKTKIEKIIKDWQMDHNSGICMSYFAPTSTSVSDLVSYCDIVQSKYKNECQLKSVSVDYLDLLRSGQVFDLHRLEMGQVTIDMKVAAVTQGVPWLSVTQLNRSISINSTINIKGIGETEFKNVQLGDKIEGANGEFRCVTKVYPKETKKCYKITTKSGKTIICGPKHNFPTPDGLKNIKYNGLKVGDKLYVKNDSKEDK